MELQTGDRVRLPGGVVRTVAEVQRTNLIGAYGAPLYFVAYAEGRTKEWGPANSAVETSEWSLVCSCGHDTDDHSYSHVQASSWCTDCGRWCD